MDAGELIARLRRDCIHFRGDRPCLPHREAGSRCTCESFAPVTRRGVIIKLGAAGDVLRTTPLLRALDPQSTGTKVLWITHHPDLLPAAACEAQAVTPAAIARLGAERFDFCWNLDKDPEACALSAIVNATEKKGFGLKDGVPWPLDEAAFHKFATGVDDPLSRANTKSYPEEIFEIVGMPYTRPEYWLRPPSAAAVRQAEVLLPGNGWIGLNTGAGARWTSRIWPGEHWRALCRLLLQSGLKPVLLGGPEEHDMNARLSSGTGCPYPGLHPLETFFAMLARCDVVVSGVTQAMHLAIAARVPLILINNIFNPNEFELYGRGEVVGPERACDCYYDSTCRTGRECIREIQPAEIAKKVLAARHDGR